MVHEGYLATSRLLLVSLSFISLSYTYMCVSDFVSQNIRKVTRNVPKFKGGYPIFFFPFFRGNSIKNLVKTMYSVIYPGN